MVHDANATYTKDMHDATLVNIECGFGEAITLNEVKQRIEQRGLEDAFPIGEND